MSTLFLEHVETVYHYFLPGRLKYGEKISYFSTAHVNIYYTVLLLAEKDIKSNATVIVAFF